jgi:hypothetical protein
MVNKNLILVVIVVLAIVGVLGFLAFSGKGNSKDFPIENGVVNCGYDEPCLKENLILCTESKFSAQLLVDTYNITILGIEDEKCHFKMYLHYVNFDCLYPLTETNEELYNHLFTYDTTEGSCLNETCLNQEALMAKNCVKTLA